MTELELDRPHRGIRIHYRERCTRTEHDEQAPEVDAPPRPLEQAAPASDSPVAPMTFKLRHPLSGEHGHTGIPLVFLHGGWGYLAYPLDKLMDRLGERRIIIPDRSGYGRSTPRDRLPVPLHAAAARETLAFLDALGLSRVALWGHSDGAVIAAIIACDAPARIAALVLESIHLDRHKPASRAFFAGMVETPDELGERMIERLRQDHGERWRDVLRMEGEAWLDILAGANDPRADFYGDRLADIRVPTLLVHGLDDPRTEPGELARISDLLPHAERLFLADGGHCPHARSITAPTVGEAVAAFLARHAAR